MKGIYIEAPHGLLKLSDGHLTVLEVHRKLQEWSDDNHIIDEKYQIDITDLNPSVRTNDYVIRILKPYRITQESFKYIHDGIIVQGDDEIYEDKISKAKIYRDHIRIMESYKNNPNSIWF